MVAVKFASSLRLQGQSARRPAGLSSRFPASRTSRDLMRPFPADHDRQMLDRLDAGPFAPGNFRFIDGERQGGPTPQQGFQRASTFNARELMAKAEMDPGAECDVPVRPSL
jgi:hypothetical protein